MYQLRKTFIAQLVAFSELLNGMILAKECSLCEFKIKMSRKIYPTFGCTGKITILRHLPYKQTTCISH